jgi:outer membrane protein OmpA-like peptidoglycan-associated protein
VSPSRRRWAVPLGSAVLLAVLVSAAYAGPQRSDTAPVLSVTAPVVDIVVPTADVGGGTRTSERDRRVDVRLSSETYFGKDSPRLRPRALGQLQEVAADLRRRGPGRVRIVGYTDDLGSKARGLVLSRQRAAAVAGVLRPVLPSAQYSFTVVGRGEEDPAVPNTSEANRKLNRRVELTYTPTT